MWTIICSPTNRKLHYLATKIKMMVPLVSKVENFEPHWCILLLYMAVQFNRLYEISGIGSNKEHLCALETSDYTV